MSLKCGEEEGNCCLGTLVWVVAQWNVRLWASNDRGGSSSLVMLLLCHVHYEPAFVVIMEWKERHPPCDTLMVNKWAQKYGCSSSHKKEPLLLLFQLLFSRYSSLQDPNDLLSSFIISSFLQATHSGLNNNKLPHLFLETGHPPLKVNSWFHYFITSNDDITQ